MCLHKNIGPVQQIFKHKIKDNCIQNFHLGRHIVRNTVGILVLQRRARNLETLAMLCKAHPDKQRGDQTCDY